MEGESHIETDRWMDPWEGQWLREFKEEEMDGQPAPALYSGGWRRKVREGGRRGNEERSEVQP